jgi:CHAT domain-containing protein
MSPSLRVPALVWICLLLPVLALQDTQPRRFQRAYEYSLSIFHRGLLLSAQQSTAEGVRAFRSVDEGWGAHFLILEAEILFRRGHYRDALQLLTQAHPAPSDTDERIHYLVVEAHALAYQGDFALAQQRVDTAQAICASRFSIQCGYLLKTQGVLFNMLGKYDEAWTSMQSAYAFAHRYHDPDLSCVAAAHLGWIANNRGLREVAADWDRRAWREAQAIGDQDEQLIATMNLIGASQMMGDSDEPHALSERSVQEAERLGDDRTQLALLNNMAHSDFSQWRLRAAEGTFRKILAKARVLNDRRLLYSNSIALANVLIWQGRAGEALQILAECRSLVPASNEYLLDAITILNARAHSLEGRNAEAEASMRTLLERGSNPILYVDATTALAESLKRERRFAAAEGAYHAGIERFQADLARSGSFAAQVKLKYRASLLFSGAIDLFAQEGKEEAALQLADRFFSSSYEDPARSTSAFDPRAVARHSGATILTYWLGHDASYLWIVTPRTVKIVTLPSELELAPKIKEYRQAVVEMRDPAVVALGRELYATLVAPAVPYISHQGQVILIDDEALSKLNFETLPAPGAAPGQPAATGSHYWIEDVTLRTASSLTALANARTTAIHGGKLLLMGDAQQASPDYPPLLEAPLEMEMVRKRFVPAAATVLAQQSATPEAYARSNPGQYAYIHFVTHGVPSPADPLDSLIVLSRSSADDDSFKLYAREILAHPLHARLVTISACYGSGARYFVGQGMVGLGWAFQKAGAENVIGALWEISDYSTPQLMDKLYAGIQHGLPPADALRQAKLALLHGTEKFQAPFFWAPFQIYAQR